MDITFLGTGGGYPVPRRGCSAVILRYLNSGTCWLFDCGEGTQIQCQRATNVHMGKISRIFISHLHGDHVYGLPGLLCTLDQWGAKRNGSTKEDKGVHMHIYGPPGLRKFIRLSLGLSRTNLNYTYAVHELIMNDEHRPKDWTDQVPTDADPKIYPLLLNEYPGRDIEPTVDGFWQNIIAQDGSESVVHAIALRHTVPCVGWLILTPPSLPSIRLEAAQSFGIPPGPLLGKLKKGQEVVVNGLTVKPEDVLGRPRRGNQLAIMGDSSDSTELLRLMRMLHGRGEMVEYVLDVLVHEATFEHNLAQIAEERGHSTPVQVATLAAELNARLLVLTHFSQRYSDGAFECSGSNSRSDKNQKTTDFLLNEAKSVIAFKGDVVAASDFLILPLPPV